MVLKTRCIKFSLNLILSLTLVVCLVMGHSMSVHAAAVYRQSLQFSSYDIKFNMSKDQNIEVVNLQALDPYTVDFVVPDDCDRAVLNMYFSLDVNGNNLAVNGVYLSGAGIPYLQQGIYSGNRYFFSSYIDVIPGSTFSTSNYSLTLNLSTGLDIGSVVSMNVTFEPVNDSRYNYIEFYQADRSSIGDSLEKQTQDLTNGFDSSTGDQVASDLQTGIDDYITKEDEVFDQMQYDVPEISIADDGSAIMLASNFMQSLYISNSFISKCITFVLTFGLILYIVGWLKKRS